MLDVFRLVNTTNWKKWCKEFPYFVPNTICQRKKKVPKRIVIHAWVQFLITSKSRYICRVSWAAVREVLKSLLSISFNAFWLTSGVLSPLLNAILYTSFALSMKWMHCLQASFFIMGMCLHARLPQFFSLAQLRTSCNLAGIIRRHFSLFPPVTYTCRSLANLYNHSLLLRGWSKLHSCHQTLLLHAVRGGCIPLLSRLCNVHMFTATGDTACDSPRWKFRGGHTCNILNSS